MSHTDISPVLCGPKSYRFVELLNLLIQPDGLSNLASVRVEQLLYFLSRFEHLVSLLSPLQALHSFAVHFLFHLLESLPFLLGGTLGSNCLDSSLIFH